MVKSYESSKIEAMISDKTKAVCIPNLIGNVAKEMNLVDYLLVMLKEPIFFTYTYVIFSVTTYFYNRFNTVIIELKP